MPCPKSCPLALQCLGGYQPNGFVCADCGVVLVFERAWDNKNPNKDCPHLGKSKQSFCLACILTHQKAKANAIPYQE